MKNKKKQEEVQDIHNVEEDNAYEDNGPESLGGGGEDEVEGWGGGDEGEEG
jgi:hypothetical protein